MANGSSCSCSWQVDALVDFINVHEHPLLKGKSTTAATLTRWINQGKQLAEKEKARRDANDEKGRGSDDVSGSSIAPHIIAWYELMEDYLLMPKPTDQSGKFSRYAVLKHLTDLGIQLQKTDSPFIPGHRDITKAVQLERKVAIQEVQQKAKRPRNEEKTGDVVAGADSESSNK